MYYCIICIVLLRVGADVWTQRRNKYVAVHAVKNKSQVLVYTDKTSKKRSYVLRYEDE